MVTVEQALDLISTHVAPLGTEKLPVADALGMVLAAPVRSLIDMPPFPQSAMDGYVLGRGDRNAGDSFKVIGEVAAGSSTGFSLSEGEAVRIFTGAPVPSSAVAVVQQEWVERADDTITLARPVPEAMHIRPQGEQLHGGEIAADAGIPVTPATVGLLHMVGRTEAEVYRRPRVTVLVTGSELIPAGNRLAHGQVYESNSAMLLAALAQMGIRAKAVSVPDDRQRTVEAIAAALAESDLLLLSGGISVGDHDHVHHALTANGVEQVFYKVQQKPGKPLYFGQKGGRCVFALPGNPAAALTCYHIYVSMALRLMMGHSNAGPPSMMLPLNGGSIRPMDRAQFLKARVEDGRVTVLGGQSSAMLHSFATANALIHVPHGSIERTEGDTVQVFMLMNGSF